MADLSIYDEVRCYDLAFMRDYAAECDFLEWVLRRHARTDERSFLELGCGPAGHARELVRRGYRGAGLDLSPAMVGYAATEARREGLALTTIEADMTDFALGERFAAVACLNETLASLTTDELVAAFLRRVGEHTLPGGLCVLQLGHPRDVVLPYQGRVRGGKDGDREVEWIWGRPEDPWDPVTLEGEPTCVIVVREHGKEVLRREDSFRQRYLRQDQLAGMIDQTRMFTTMHWYGSIELPAIPFAEDDEANNDMVLVAVRAQ